MAKKPSKAERKKAAERLKIQKGRLGAERWLAVRRRGGAGLMEPDTRKGTRSERLRREMEAQS